jgi:hypothetical protein
MLLKIGRVELLLLFIRLAELLGPFALGVRKNKEDPWVLNLTLIPNSRGVSIVCLSGMYDGVCEDMECAGLRVSCVRYSFFVGE